jgi:hypothetical protein
MKQEDLLAEMKASVGTKDPLEYFTNMVNVLSLLLNKIDSLENKLQRVQTQSALAIQWEPRVASNLLSKEIDLLRKDKDTYFNEIAELKQAFVEDLVTQNYQQFCKFWQDTLGFHPFLD